MNLRGGKHDDVVFGYLNRKRHLQIINRRSVRRIIICQNEHEVHGEGRSHWAPGALCGGLGAKQQQDHRPHAGRSDGQEGRRRRFRPGQVDRGNGQWRLSETISARGPDTAIDSE